MNQPHAHDDGYRAVPAAGPRIRSDVVDVYIVQRAPRPPRELFTSPAHSGRNSSGMDSDGADPAPSRRQTYFLQLLRAGPPLANSWHPVMGHVELGETAVQTMWRELSEELGLAQPAAAASTPLLGVWALEQVHPFFIAELDAIVLSPRFAAEVTPGWMPALNEEHTRFRWVASSDVAHAFMWPGQIAACREISDALLPDPSLMRPWVSIWPRSRP